MAQTVLSGVAGGISGSRVQINNISYVESQEQPVGLMECWVAEQGTAAGSRSPSLEYPIITTSGISGGALSDAFSAMTPGPITIASTTIAPALQGASSGATNGVLRDVDFDIMNPDGIVDDALRLAIGKRANTLRNTAGLTITASVGGATAASWATLRSAVTTARGTKGNHLLVAATVPRKVIEDLNAEVGADGAAVLANPNVQDGGPYDRLRMLTAELWSGEGEPQSFYLRDMNLLLTVAERDSDCPTNGGNYEIPFVIAPPNYQAALRMNSASSSPSGASPRKPVTPTLGLVVAPNPVPAFSMIGNTPKVDDFVLGIPVTLLTRAYSGADGIQRDIYAAFNVGLLVDSACRMLVIQ